MSEGYKHCNESGDKDCVISQGTVCKNGFRFPIYRSSQNTFARLIAVLLVAQ